MVDNKLISAKDKDMLIYKVKKELKKILLLYPDTRWDNLTDEKFEELFNECINEGYGVKGMRHGIFIFEVKV
jgi:hypothetical protein